MSLEVLLIAAAMGNFFFFRLLRYRNIVDARTIIYADNHQYRNPYCTYRASRCLIDAVRLGGHLYIVKYCFIGQSCHVDSQGTAGAAVVEGCFSPLCRQCGGRILGWGCRVHPLVSWTRLWYFDGFITISSTAYSPPTHRFPPWKLSSWFFFLAWSHRFLFGGFAQYPCRDAVQFARSGPARQG